MLIGERAALKNKYLTKAFQAILLSLLFFLVLYVWSVGHIIIWHPDGNELTISNIIIDFDYNFKGFIWVVILEALLIPIIYDGLNKKKTALQKL